MPLPAQEPVPSELPDGVLVILAQKGDVEAVETLFARYHTRICLYLIRMMGDDETGYELAQETFVKAWESLPRLRDNTRFMSWLYRIATNLARDYQRRSRRIQWLPWENQEEAEEHSGLSIAGPERQVEETELMKLALKQVSLKYRACVVLQIVEEMPQRQIAELLGIHENSVSKYVSRGLRELRQAYGCLINEPESFKGKEQ